MHDLLQFLCVSIQQSVVNGVHLLGALMAFFLGLAYFWVQAWLAYYSPPSRDRRWVVPVRVILCSQCTCLVICSILQLSWTMKISAFSLHFIIVVLNPLSSQCLFSMAQGFALKLPCVSGLWSCVFLHCLGFLQQSSDTLTFTSSPYRRRE